MSRPPRDSRAPLSEDRPAAAPRKRAGRGGEAGQGAEAARRRAAEPPPEAIPRRRTERAATPTPQRGAATGAVKLVLRADGLVLAAAALAGQIWLGASWWGFVLAAVAPDLSMAGYALGRRAGSILYNAAHALVGPILLGMLAVSARDPLLGSFALAWLLHIGVDQALGYGLKYASGFGDTHLGRIGTDWMRQG